MNQRTPFEERRALVRTSEQMDEYLDSETLFTEREHSRASLDLSQPVDPKLLHQGAFLPEFMPLTACVPHAPSLSYS